MPFVLAGVLLVAIPLLMVPPLRWGWWSALGGDGNPIFGSSSTTSGTVWAWLIPLVFMCLVVLALPLFANAEERMFRSGAQRWSKRRRVLKVVQFGAIHALIGIPIGVALALSVGGAYFMSVYLRAYARHRQRPRGNPRIDAGAHRVQRTDHRHGRHRRRDRRRRLTGPRR